MAVKVRQFSYRRRADLIKQKYGSAGNTMNVKRESSKEKLKIKRYGYTFRIRQRKMIFIERIVRKGV